MTLEEALSGTHELRIIVRMLTAEEQLAWHETIARLRQQEGCISIFMQPVDAVVTNVELTVPEGGPLKIENIPYTTECYYAADDPGTVCPVHEVTHVPETGSVPRKRRET